MATVAFACCAGLAIPLHAQTAGPPELRVALRPVVLRKLRRRAQRVPVREQLYDRIQAIVLRDVPYYTMRWAAVTDMRAVNLQGVRPPITGSTFWNVADWQFR